jgi:carbon-monoxide dehydrogenase small subunit
MMKMTVNGVSRRTVTEPRTLLVDVLRHQFGLTGTHVGCDQGGCGACTVFLDGAPVRSCITLAAQADGATIETIEALAPDGNLNPIQDAFRKNHGLQCGFCTPGMVMTTRALLEENPDPTEDEIREYLSGNVCRCTGYVGIVAAVKEAAQRLTEEPSPSTPTQLAGGE